MSKTQQLFEQRKKEVDARRQTQLNEALAFRKEREKKIKSQYRAEMRKLDDFIMERINRVEDIAVCRIEKKKATTFCFKLCVKNFNGEMARCYREPITWQDLPKTYAYLSENWSNMFEVVSSRFHRTNKMWKTDYYYYTWKSFCFKIKSP